MGEVSVIFPHVPQVWLLLPTAPGFLVLRFFSVKGFHSTNNLCQVLAQALGLRSDCDR